MGWLAGLRLAFGLLTTLPISQPTLGTSPQDGDLFGRSFAWYPLVGVAVGGLLAGAAWLLGWSQYSREVQAWVLLSVWVLATGGLHLDGFMDSCDALFAPVSVERRLEILKDVHAGAFGILGLVLLVGLKWALLTQLLAASPALLAIGLVLAPAWGRWTLAWMAWRYPYARPGPSLGRTVRQGLGSRQVAVATALTLAVQVVAAGFHLPALWALCGPLSGFLLARWMARRLGGGLTGDTYGALCELVEMGVLLGLAG